MDKALRVAGDFELWSRFFEHAELYTLAVPLGIFRFQKLSFTSTEFDAYTDVCRRVLVKFGRRPPSRIGILGAPDRARTAGKLASAVRTGIPGFAYRPG